MDPQGQAGVCAWAERYYIYITIAAARPATLEMYPVDQVADAGTNQGAHQNVRKIVLLLVNAGVTGVTG